METVCKTDYQDIYRIKDGVLLIINKFRYITNEDGTRDYIGYPLSNKHYASNCQSSLCVLTEEYYDRHKQRTYNVGQMIYRGYPIELTDKSEWNFQIKTTGDALSGDIGTIVMLLNEIIGRILSDDV